MVTIQFPPSTASDGVAFSGKVAPVANGLYVPSLIITGVYPTGQIDYPARSLKEASRFIRQEIAGMHEDYERHLESDDDGGGVLIPA